VGREAVPQKCSDNETQWPSLPFHDAPKICKNGTGISAKTNIYAYN